MFTNVKLHFNDMSAENCMTQGSIKQQFELSPQLLQAQIDR